MSKAIFVRQPGGTQAMYWDTYDPGAPGPGEARVRHEAIGLNFIDIYHRSGLYPVPKWPLVPGLEGAGIVTAVGPEVAEVSVGARVAYAGVPPGAYAQERLIPAHRLVPLPDEVTMEQAAAIMLKGMTARYLLYGCHVVKPGNAILIHAAAGGVGSIVCQWARDLGATVIGTVGSEQKADYAAQQGCAHPILYQKEDFVSRVKAITAGAGVDVVYDSVGQATFIRSLDCLKPLGTLVSFGQSSGPIAPFDPSLLATKGSLFLTRPSLMTYTAHRADLLAHARDLFDVIRKGAVRVEIRQCYPLAEAARAHQELELRRTMGQSVLLPF
jgi:NADPH2:quinone reductase